MSSIVYVATGNVVVGLLFGTMDTVQSHITFLRFDGAMDYFATLSIELCMLIIAMALSFLLLAVTVGSLWLVGRRMAWRQGSCDGATGFADSRKAVYTRGTMQRCPCRARRRCNDGKAIPVGCDQDVRGRSDDDVSRPRDAHV